VIKTTLFNDVNNLSDVNHAFKGASWYLGEVRSSSVPINYAWGTNR